MRAVGRNLRALETFARYLLDPTTQKFRKEAATKQNNYINVNLVLDIVLITVTIIILIITMIVLIIMIITSNVEKYSTVTPCKLYE